MTDLNAEIDKAVETATSEEEFDALDFFSHSKLPEEIAVLHQDTEAAYRLAEITRQIEANKALEEDEGIGITDEVPYIDEDEVTELKRRLKDSAVTFHVRALAPAEREAIEKKARASNPYTEGGENPEYNEDYNGTLIAKSIRSVTNAKGKKDSKPWDKERVIAFSQRVESSEWMKLFEAVFKVNYIGDAVDRAVNADF